MEELTGLNLQPLPVGQRGPAWAQYPLEEPWWLWEDLDLVSVRERKLFITRNFKHTHILMYIYIYISIYLIYINVYIYVYIC